MNKKEKTVLFFLCITFLVGASVSFIRNYEEKKNLQAISLKKTIIDTIASTQTNSIIENDKEDSYESSLININTASAKELEALPGIGPVIAQRIVEYRQKYGGFKSKVDILKVSGIGPKKFEALKDKIIIK